MVNLNGLIPYAINRGKAVFSGCDINNWSTIAPKLLELSSKVNNSISCADAMVDGILSSGLMSDFTESTKTEFDEEISTSLDEFETFWNALRNCSTFQNEVQGETELNVVSISLTDGRVVTFTTEDIGDRHIMNVVDGVPVKWWSLSGSDSFRHACLLAQDGSSVSASDVLQSLTESSSINQVIDTAISSVTDGDFSIEKFSSALSWAQNSYRSIKSTFYGIIDAWRIGGLYGVVRYLLGYFSAVSGLNVSGGKLTFTNNASFVPQEYIAGIVTTVLTTVAAVAGAVIAVFAPVAGALTSLLVNAITAIPKALNYDYETATLCSLDSKAAFNVAPFAPFQFNFGDGSSGQYAAYVRDLKEMVKLHGVMFCEVPGGYCFFGSNTDEVNDESSLLMEFHPLVNLSGLLEAPIFEFSTGLTGSWDGHASAEINCGFKYAMDPSNLEYYMTRYPQVKATSTVPSESVSILSDDVIRLWLLANCGLFILYASSYASDFHTQFNLKTSQEPSSLSGFANACGFYVYRYAESNKNNTYLSALAICLTYTHSKTVTLTYNGQQATRTFSAIAYDSGVGISPGWSDFTGWSFFSDGLPVVFGGISVNVAQILSVLAGRVKYSEYTGTRGKAVSFRLRVPQFNRSTFWGWVALAAVTTTILVTAIAVTSVKVSKAIKMARLKQQAKVDAAWTKAVATEKTTPGGKTVPKTAAEMAADRTAYYKTAVSANWVSTIIGGTKYDTTNYWGSGGSSEDSNASVLSKFVSDPTNMASSESEYETIIKLIAGPHGLE